MKPEPPASNKRIRTVTVGTRYPADRAALIKALKERRGDTFDSDTVRHLLDTGLVREGLLDAHELERAA